MTTHKKLDLNEIIAKNPKVSRADLAKGVQVLRELEQTGAVKPSSYALETADRKTIRYSENDVCVVKGTTIRIAR